MQAVPVITSVHLAYATSYQLVLTWRHSERVEQAGVAHAQSSAIAVRTTSKGASIHGTPGRSTSSTQLLSPSSAGGRSGGIVPYSSGLHGSVGATAEGGGASPQELAACPSDIDRWHVQYSPRYLGRWMEWDASIRVPAAVISGLEPGNRYSVRVRAHSRRAGWGPWTAAGSDFFTLEDGDGYLPAKASAEQVSQMQLYIMAAECLLRHAAADACAAAAAAGLDDRVAGHAIATIRSLLTGQVANPMVPAACLHILLSACRSPATAAAELDRELSSTSIDTPATATAATADANPDAAPPVETDGSVVADSEDAHDDGAAASFSHDEEDDGTVPAAAPNALLRLLRRILGLRQGQATEASGSHRRNTGTTSSGRASSSSLLASGSAHSYGTASKPATAAAPTPLNTAAAPAAAAAPVAPAAAPRPPLRYVNRYGNSTGRRSAASAAAAGGGGGSRSAARASMSDCQRCKMALGNGSSSSKAHVCGHCYRVLCGRCRSHTYFFERRGVDAVTRLGAIRTCLECALQLASWEADREAQAAARAAARVDDLDFDRTSDGGNGDTYPALLLLPHPDERTGSQRARGLQVLSPPFVGFFVKLLYSDGLATAPHVDFSSTTNSALSLAAWRKASQWLPSHLLQSLDTGSPTVVAEAAASSSADLLNKRPYAAASDASLEDTAAVPLSALAGSGLTTRAGLHTQPSFFGTETLGEGALVPGSSHPVSSLPTALAHRSSTMDHPAAVQVYSDGRVILPAPRHHPAAVVRHLLRSCTSVLEYTTLLQAHRSEVVGLHVVRVVSEAHAARAAAAAASGKAPPPLHPSVQIGLLRQSYLSLHSLLKQARLDLIREPGLVITTTGHTEEELTAAEAMPAAEGVAAAADGSSGLSAITVLHVGDAPWAEAVRPGPRAARTSALDLADASVFSERYAANPLDAPLGETAANSGPTLSRYVPLGTSEAYSRLQHLLQHHLRMAIRHLCRGIWKITPTALVTALQAAGCPDSHAPGAAAALRKGYELAETECVEALAAAVIIACSRTHSGGDAHAIAHEVFSGPSNAGPSLPGQPRGRQLVLLRHAQPARWPGLDIAKHHRCSAPPLHITFPALTDDSTSSSGGVPLLVRTCDMYQIADFHDLEGSTWALLQATLVHNMVLAGGVSSPSDVSALCAAYMTAASSFFVAPAPLDETRNAALVAAAKSVFSSKHSAPATGSTTSATGGAAADELLSVPFLPALLDRDRQLSITPVGREAGEVRVFLLAASGLGEVAAEDSADGENEDGEDPVALALSGKAGGAYNSGTAGGKAGVQVLSGSKAGGPSFLQNMLQVLGLSDSDSGALGANSALVHAVRRAMTRRGITADLAQMKITMAGSASAAGASGEDGGGHSAFGAGPVDVFGAGSLRVAAVAGRKMEKALPRADAGALAIILGLGLAGAARAADAAEAAQREVYSLAVAPMRDVARESYRKRYGVSGTLAAKAVKLRAVAASEVSAATAASPSAAAPSTPQRPRLTSPGLSTGLLLNVDSPRLSLEAALVAAVTPSKERSERSSRLAVASTPSSHTGGGADTPAVTVTAQVTAGLHSIDSSKSGSSGTAPAVPRVYAILRCGRTEVETGKRDVTPAGQGTEGSNAGTGATVKSWREDVAFQWDGQSVATISLWLVLPSPAAAASSAAAEPPAARSGAATTTEKVSSARHICLGTATFSFMTLFPGQPERISIPITTRVHVRVPVPHVPGGQCPVCDAAGTANGGTAAAASAHAPMPDAGGLDVGAQDVSDGDSVDSSDAEEADQVGGDAAAARAGAPRTPSKALRDSDAPQVRSQFAGNSMVTLQSQRKPALSRGRTLAIGSMAQLRSGSDAALPAQAQPRSASSMSRQRRGTDTPSSPRRVRSSSASASDRALPVGADAAEEDEPVIHIVDEYVELVTGRVAVESFYWPHPTAAVTPQKVAKRQAKKAERADAAAAAAAAEADTSTTTQ